MGDKKPEFRLTLLPRNIQLQPPTPNQQIIRSLTSLHTYGFELPVRSYGTILSRFRLRILLFSSLTFKTPTKNYRYYILKVPYIYIIFLRQKVIKSHTTVGIKVFFLLFLPEDRRSRIWIRTSDYQYQIRIQETHKHMDPTDPDPEHCLKVCRYRFRTGTYLSYRTCFPA
jgi:hypothetical protein